MDGCKGCIHYLGGIYEFCAANLEDDCAAGNFEAYRPFPVQIVERGAEAQESERDDAENQL